MQFSDSEIYKAISYVKQDIQDDFWPDVIEYKDFFQYPESLLKINYSQYHPNEVLSMDIPKPNLVLRPGHHIRLSDRVYYQLLTNRIVNEIDKTSTSREKVFGYRVSRDKKLVIIY